MAHDNKASYTLIGFTVLIAVAAIVGTLIYLGGLRDGGAETIVETYYNKGVSGLSVGSPVNLRGVKIGEVREISFIGVKYPEVGELDAARIYIKMALSHEKCGVSGECAEDVDILARQFFDRLIAKGLRATVTSSGITGLSRIELDFYSPEKANSAEQLAWRPRDIFIPPQIGLLDSFSDSATKVMNQINKMDLNAAWSNIASSVKSLAMATDSARITMENRQADLEKIFDDFSEAMRSIKELTAEVRRNPSLLFRDRQRSALPETER